MPETRVVRIVYGLGGYDPTKPNSNIVEAVTAEISDDQLYQEQLAAGFNAAHEKEILALKNWGSLTLAQKDLLLQHLIMKDLYKDGWLKLGVL